MAKEGESEEETVSLAERNDRVAGLSTSGGPTCWSTPTGGGGGNPKWDEEGGSGKKAGKA